MSKPGRVQEFLSTWQRGHNKPHDLGHDKWDADECDACIAEEYDAWEAFVWAAEIAGWGPMPNEKLANQGAPPSS